MRRLKYIWLIVGLLSPLVLSGCMGGGGGGGDMLQMLENPLVQIMIGGIVLWLVFKSSKKGE